MNKWTLAAGVLSSAIFLLHLIGGELTVHQPTLASGLNQELKAYASVLWHMATGVLALNSLALLNAARKNGPQALVQLIAAQYAIFTAVFLFYGITRFGSVWIMPQWSIFAATTALALIGQRRARS